jgi:hypothetical protein
MAAEWNTGRVAALVRTTCVACGPVEVRAAEVRLMQGLNAKAASVIEFDCPTCGQHHREPTTERGTRLLIAAGVAVVVPAYPALETDSPADTAGY